MNDFLIRLMIEIFGWLQQDHLGLTAKNFSGKQGKESVS